MTDGPILRRLSAILAADVAGYSRLVAADEVGTLSRFRKIRAEILDPAIARFGGTLVGTAGDSLLVEFTNALAAVECAIACQRELARLNDPEPEDRRILFRMGINLGDVIAADGTIHGDGVNVAARIEKLAEPGGIAVSGSVHDLVEGKLGISFADLGQHEVKNIAKPVRVHRAETGAGSSGLAAMAKSAQADKTSIAVLPFDNMSGDTEQLYFSDGITEDIITELSRFRELLVIARNSSFQFRGKATDVRDVAKKLGVRFVVEGSVRKAGSRVRINAQLIDAETSAHIWADRFDGDLADVFELQDQVTRRIVGAIAPKLELAGIERAHRKPTESLDAYDCFLRGLHHIRSYAPGDNERARDLFQKAMELDPGFAPALAYRGWADVVIHDYAEAPEDVLDRAKEMAARAVSMDGGNGRCHWVLGLVEGYRGNARAEEWHLRRAIEINPHDANSLCALGSALAASEKFDEALAVTREAFRINPFHPDWYWIDLGNLLYAAKRYEEAIDAFERKAQPGHWVACFLAACHAQLGNDADARRHATRARELKAGPQITPRRLRHWGPAQTEHILEGMRKAGLYP